MFVFEGRERIRVSDILGEVVPDMRAETGKRAKAMSFAVEASEFEYTCVCLMKSGESGKGCTAAVVEKGRRRRNQ